MAAPTASKAQRKRIRIRLPRARRQLRGHTLHQTPKSAWNQAHPLFGDSDLRKITSYLTNGLALTAILALLAFTPALRAQQADQSNHLVSPNQLQQQVQSASTARQKNIDALTQFLSSPTAVQAMRSKHIDPNQVKNAIPALSDSELASLSARAADAQQQFAAGSMSNQTLLIIILVLVAVILIAVIH
jgi:hypothetical protein